MDDISVKIWSYAVYRYNFIKHNNRFAYFLMRRKNKAIESYLWKKYFCVKENTDKYDDLYCNKDIKRNFVIWSFWWQGKDMPDLIQVSLKSQKKNSNNHSIIVITKENIREYVKLPQYIWDKFEQNKITITHLSDIVRFYLLACYGGLWLDATVYVSQRLEDKIFEYDYYTIKMPRKRYGCVSEFRWNGAVMAAKAEGIFCKKMLSLFYSYWKREKQLIDYFLIDYFTDMVFQCDEQCMKNYEKVPMAMCNLYLLEENLNELFTQKYYDMIINQSVFHKLSRKKDYVMVTIDGQKTIWGHIKDEI